MASKRISDLTSLAQASLATGDLLPIVDISDTVANQNKKITATALVLGALSLANQQIGIGGSSNANYQVYVTGTHANVAAATASALRLDVTVTSLGAATGFDNRVTLNPAAGSDAMGAFILATLNKAGSGTHPDFVGLRIDPPNIGAGAAALTNATTLKITGAPSVGTNQRALWVADGLVQFTRSTSTDVLWLQGANTSANSLSMRVPAGEVAAIKWDNSTGLNGAANGLAFDTGGGPISFRPTAVEQVRINYTAGATRYLTLTGSNGGAPQIATSGGNLDLASNSGIVTFSGGTISKGADSALDFGTGSTYVKQVSVTHTASATRYITLTGSNGGNPTIGVSGGSLAIANTVYVAGALSVAETNPLYLDGGVDTSIVSDSADEVSFFGGGARRMKISSAGNIKIAGTAVRATTEGTNHLDIFDGTAPVGTLANGISLYSTSGELRVMDAAGNATLLSPHDSETNEWIYDSVETTTGRRLRIDMERFVKAVNDILGLDCVHEIPAA